MESGMKCSNCGKDFDYEKYYGICPKCGTFNRNSYDTTADAWPDKDPYEDHQKFHERYDSGFFHGKEEENPSIYTYVEDEVSGRKECRKAFSGKKSGRIFIAVCILLIMVCTAGMAIVTAVKDRIYYKEALLLEQPVPVTVKQGEEFSLGIHTFQIGSARILEHAGGQPGFPDGEKCIAVTVKRSCDVDEMDYENRASFPYLFYSSAQGRKIYKECMNETEMEAYETYYGIHLLDNYEFCFEAECEGELVFFVDESVDTVTLCLEERFREDGAVEKLMGLWEAELALTEGVTE